jgi:hypothetical protein
VPVDRVPVGSGVLLRSGGFGSTLHLTFPLMSNRYSVLWVRYQNHVCSVFSPGISILLDGPIHQVMYFPCLSAGDLRFLVLPLPARDMGLPYGCLLSVLTDPIGVTVSRILEMRAGWAPSQLAGRSGVLTYRGIACMPS